MPHLRAFVLIYCLAGIASGQDSNNPQIHPLFSDHMVLQRGKAVPVWGWAKPGTTVTVSFAGASATATASDAGKWTTYLGPFEASAEGRPLTVRGREAVTFKDVVVGDVWICSGQSNMEWPVAASRNAQEEIAAAHHPNIRLFTVPKRISTIPQEIVDGTWTVCGKDTVSQFSAVGYFFGRELHKSLGLPIGLIHTSWGGTVAEAWTSGEALKSSMPDFTDALTSFNRTVAEISENKLTDPQQFGNNPNTVTVLFNGMLAPLTPFGITGAIWYQGESNAQPLERAMQYRRLLPTMIADWRDRFRQGDFPFLVVQLANFMQPQEQPVQSGWAELREAQLLTARRDDHVGLAVTTDIGEAFDIHPKNKQDVGKRLALQALHIAYGQELVHSGPTLKDMSIVGDTLHLAFDNVGSGLVIRGERLKGFAIAEAEGEFVWADAEVEGDTVIVAHEDLAEPIRVRYNWANNPIGNLFNKEGLPAGPFRTDVAPTPAPSRPQASGQLPTAKPEEVGMSSEKLAKVKPRLQRFVDEGKVPGAIAVVAKDGKIVLFESVGYRDISKQEPMSKDSILRFYSMTKAITSVSIMMLVEEGSLGLNDPVEKYIPEFRGLKVANPNENDGGLLDQTRRMTVRDLLRHTSGLTYGFFGNTAVDVQYRNAGVLGSNDTLGDTIAKLGKLPLLYQPGTRFNYSVSTDVLGYIIERVTGLSLDEFFQQRVFDPLDMRDTGFHVDQDAVGRFADNYRLGDSGLEVSDDASSSAFLQPPKLLSGGGGLVSTARDYIRFCQMLLNDGELNGKRLLTSETVKEMTRNQLSRAAYPVDLNGPREGVGFGLGFSVVVEQTPYTKSARLGEFGWGGAASTHFWISPADQLAVVVLTQHQPFSFQLEDAVKPLIYDAIID